ALRRERERPARQACVQGNLEYARAFPATRRVSRSRSRRNAPLHLPRSEPLPRPPCPDSGLASRFHAGRDIGNRFRGRRTELAQHFENRFELLVEDHNHFIPADLPERGSERLNFIMYDAAIALRCLARPCPAQLCSHFPAAAPAQVSVFLDKDTMEAARRGPSCLLDDGVL